MSGWRAVGWITFGGIAGAGIVIFYFLHALWRWWQGGENKGWKKDGNG